jgi:5-methylcytosine-specific restriction enzyme subunit McrC
MERPKPIKVFEHQRLPWKETGLTTAQVDRLIAWNESSGNRFFTVGHKSFTFTEHVGVVQVGRTVIEVLPKADRSEGDDANTKTKWQSALLTMLREVYDLPLTSTTEAELHKRTSSILDFFFGLYVSDVEELVHQGLVKRYRRTRGNQSALKGRLDFPRHLHHNLIHQERFYVEHQVYDTDHLLHSLLKRALSLVADLGRDTEVTGRAKGLDWAFENVADRQLNPQALDRIILNRKTAPYARAVQLAKMIVLNHAPDVKGGNMPLIGLMFNMNQLFEEFVFRVLRKAARAPEFHGMDLTIRNQRSVPFWNHKTIIPDMVMDYMREGHRKRIIVDTKWKVPPNGKPNDADLKQMFVYNVQFDACEGVLLYPATASSAPSSGHYASTVRLPGWTHRCRMEHARIFASDGSLCPGAGRSLLQALIHLPTPHHSTLLLGP